MIKINSQEVTLGGQHTPGVPGARLQAAAGSYKVFRYQGAHATGGTQYPPLEQ